MRDKEQISSILPVASEVIFSDIGHFLGNVIKDIKVILNKIIYL